MGRLAEESAAIEDFDHLIIKVFGREAVDSEDQISELEWKMCMKSFYLEEELNANRLIQMLGNYTVQEQSQLIAFQQRVTRVFSRAQTLNARVFIDAE